MRDDVKFLDTVQRIMGLIREDAVKRLGYNSIDEIKLNMERFYSEVHSDFQIAQNLILENLINEEKQLEQLKSELKSKRIVKNNDEIKELKSEIWWSGFRQNVFRKLTDSIAWQLIKGQHYIARRFYIREKPPVLLKSNIADVKHRVDKLNKEDNQSFALINDLSSFLQIGDILRKTQDGLYIIEAKDGEMNDVARSILDYLGIENAEELKNILSEPVNDKLKTQILRMHRQDLRANRAVEVINNEEGIDPYSGQLVKIFETRTTLDFFYDEIKILIHESRKKDWAYYVIDDCLHIGAYRNQWKYIGKKIIEKIVYMISGKKIPAFSLLQNLLIQITEPIFLKPFDDDIIRELLSGEVIVFMSIDFNKVIELFNQKGMSARWLSRKETHTLKQNKFYANELLIFEDRAIGLSKGKVSGELANGFLTRIISDNLYPRITVDLFAESYQY